MQVSSRFASLVVREPRSRGRVRLTARSSYRSDSGLTTLEWLLIVAAVAGLAALAVVLVQNVVDETAEEIAGNSARETAAKVAADRIDADARTEIRNADSDTDATKITINQANLDSINSEFESKCGRLKITYSDINLTATWGDFPPALITQHANAAALDTELAKHKESCKVEASDS